MQVTINKEINSIEKSITNLDLARDRQRRRKTGNTEETEKQIPRVGRERNKSRRLRTGRILWKKEGK